MLNTEPIGSYGEFLKILGPTSALLSQAPVHEELLSIERLEQYAAQLATELKITARPKRGRSLNPELKKSAQQLEIAYQHLAASLGNKEPVSPAAEWFVDNFHIIENQLREIKLSLPEDYYYGLPQLAEGELKGYPRVYALALAIIAHTDSRLDTNTLQRVLRSFQQISPLEIGEIWALVITLRIVLVQHLTPLANSIVSARNQRQKADAFADRLLDFAIKPQAKPEDLAALLSQEMGPPEKFDRVYLVQLIQRLRDQEPDVAPAFDWIERQLEKRNTNTQQVTQFEHHRQAATQVTIGNIIGSMRLLSTLDWRQFFESVHLGEEILAQDPTHSYLEMDFATRDQYRHAIERLSKRSHHSELEVARRAVEASLQAPAGSRARHVGYFLMGDGKSEFEKNLGYKMPLRERIHRSVHRHPTFIYLSGIFVFTIAFLIPVIGALLDLQASPTVVAIFTLIALFPASELGISLLNHYVHFFMRPTPLPRMNTEHGIPRDAGTIVVIPTLFLNEHGVQELLERLEIHWLANQDPNLQFALLGDFGDSSEQETSQDKELLDFALRGIENLNQRYSTELGPKFHLFHRKRLWNPSEEKWIGWERKRGKLLEFNRLLRGAQDTSYILSTAAPEELSHIQYVVTLDSDTQVPRDAVQKLVGTILHPLNQPHFDPGQKRVTSGYGILQPRISITSASAHATRFARISSGNIGLDPYTTAVSDVYQDLFAEGSFTGKGLYVVDAFEMSMENRVPENSVLSHDLFEGSFARSALVTDVEFLDDYPSDYDKYSKRQHRWTRGDWQIAPWLLPWAPSSDGNHIRNTLPLIAKWKILDNLRRSVVPIFTLLWLTLAWTVLPGSPSLWTALIVLLYLFPVYSQAATGQWLRRRGLTWSGYFAGGWREFQIKLSQIFITVAFLAQQAWTQSDAISRVFYRKLVSKKHLLEWMTHAQMESHSHGPFHFKEMLSAGPILAVLIGAAILQFRPEALGISSPFLALWITNPWLKRWLARKPKVRKKPLGESEKQEFRSYARATWHFFETFLGPEDNWLAPDNFQEDPKPVVAHRTSPTNIGLQFLAMASAYDLGYIGQLELIEKAEKAFATLLKLQRLHGHFFNWYDTQSLQPLQPRYISTVDSGNLAGHLLTFKQFLVSLEKKPRSLQQMRKGLLDTVIQLRNAVHRLQVPASGASTLQQLQRLAKTTQILISDSVLSRDHDWQDLLNSAVQNFLEMQSQLKALSIEEVQDGFAEIQIWMNSCLHQVYEFKRDRSMSQQEELRSREKALMQTAEQLALEMDFKFLFDEKRKLFVIGYNVNESRRDNSYYDLLASESRLASFVAIAKGDVEQEHWFRLGRRMTPVRNGRALIAWTATMFEYLMPILVMRRYENTLLSQTYEAIVQRQIEYGMQKGVPWGVSEAGYNARDLHMNYQYGPFGVPGLGLKRGLSDELVVSPYSTFLASQIDPWEALENLRRLKKLGAYSRFGFYESLDYTTERLPKKQKFAILKSYMAHHQGMSLVAMDNLLNGSIMQRRFHSDPLVKATQLLLQERIPQSVPLSRPRAEETRSSGFLHSFDPNPRSYFDVFLNVPRTQMLSNGVYSVLVTSTGSGYSRCAGLAINRWREDATRDHWGQFFYIRNRDSGAYWSAAHQPTLKAPDRFEVGLAEDKVEFTRRDQDAVTRTEIVVSPEDNVELRRISITNDSTEVRDFEVTSFMETVLARPQDDAAHPAFSNLFVQTEFLSHGSALLATRRQRSKNEKQNWGFHLVTTDAAVVGSIQYETDRSRFLGRGRTAQEPLVLAENLPLSNSIGSVLDPIFSLRQTVRIQPGETASVIFATGLGSSREEALNLIDKYREPHMFQRETEIAWTQSQVQLRHLNISVAQAHTFQKLAGRVLYLDSSLRASSRVLAQNTRAQSHLWAYGISGDLPIILTRIHDEKDMAMVRELLRAHEYFRLKGLAVDLVILNERPTSYLQSLQDEIQRQIRMSGSQSFLDKPGGIFIRRTDLMPPEDVILLRTVARVTLNADRGTLDEQLRHRKPRSELPAALQPSLAPRKYPSKNFATPDLQFFNSLGGFTQDNREYVIVLKEGQTTPAPWINVVANSHDFGFIISESGSSYTWSANSRENRLTPWSNDPVSDPSGEAIYLRDEETGEIWTPTPLPIREAEPYLIRHGQGYSRFEHTSHGIEQDLQIFVALENGVKISRLRLKNLSSAPRKISVTSYVEWVLGFQRSQTAAYIIPEVDSQTGAIFARNPYNNEFASRIAFSDISEENRTYTCDRREFIGRNGTLSQPAALRRKGLTKTSGAGLDPCASFQTSIQLAPNEERTIVVLLGQTENEETARQLVQKYRNLRNVETAFQEVQNYWDRTLSTVEIKTPDTAMNTLVNRWLLYQTLACRVWARSAFYQSGGAFGFRDQLQDIMAILYSNPQIAREQILRAAARQFVEGDVQHWWHPPTGRGVRTHFSDDLLWLPFVASFYVKVTGDISILNETVPFIEGPPLAQGQDDLYIHPQISDQEASLFEHCARALDRSLKVGDHGLPLMGSGDWNDGMNRVGHEGYGESVWVGWFLHSALDQFLPHVEARGETQRLEAYRQHKAHLKAALEEQAWDGDWYRRAYFDDGTPLGSASNEECRIDSIAQSWSVLSGAGDLQRSLRAMNAVNEHLIRRGDGLIQLFTPPFDKTSLDPGYIKGYLPGVRENGGQYTHAAIWTLMAFAQLGDGERAAELYALLNPINHALTRAGMHKYKVEPYVIAADIYGLFPHVGRGGWTWYTGSASWMYRAALESILGFDLQGNRLRIRPKISNSWNDFEITYRFGSSKYRLLVSRKTSAEQSPVEIDGRSQTEEWIDLQDDGKNHEVRIHFI